MPNPAQISKLIKSLQKAEKAGKVAKTLPTLDDVLVGASAVSPEAELAAKLAQAKQVAEGATAKPTAAAPQVNKKKKFIDDIYKNYPAHPFMQGQRVISEGEGDAQKFAQFELKPGFGKNEVEIDWISAYPNRSGMGTKAIQELQQHAQDAGISLTVYPWDKGSVSQRALTSFYKKLGFEKLPGGSKTMIWRPQQIEGAGANTAQQGLESFLEPSAVKQRMYHGTRQDIQGFNPQKAGATFVTPSPEFADKFASFTPENKILEGANIMPLHVDVRNPFDYQNPEHVDALLKELGENKKIKKQASGFATKSGQLANERSIASGGYSLLEDPVIQNAIQNLGHDAFYVNEGGNKNLGIYDPRRIKSAIGNRGTYDITDPDITKAEGGLAQYGLRHSGEGVKGKGYFGPMAGRDGTVTELSAEDESGEYPLVVPTLTAEELDRLLAGEEPTPEMLDKASSWAATRRKRGESPFASPTELRMPRPKAEGGSVSLTDLPDEVNPSNWREHLQNNVLADARALLGAKDGGVINLDELIEQALKKKDGGAINLDDLIDWTLAKAEHRKMKEGGAVKMQGGGNPGEVAGDMFKPKPLSIPEPITDLVEALRRQFEKEKRSMRKPGAAQDVLMRGPVAAYAGAPADILGMGGELLDYAQKKIPALRKPASVMDTGPEKTPPMGYAPVFPLSPEGSYGTTAAQEMMGKAGLTTGEERPLFETGAMVGAPVAGYAGLKAGKALAPTAKEMLDVQLQQMMSPYQMNVIKSEGGNWVRGSTDKFLSGLRYDDEVDRLRIYTPEARAEEQARVDAYNNFIDKKLKRYMENQLGTPSDPVRIQADAWVETQKTLLAEKEKQISKVRSDIEKARRERNVDPEVLTRSQARLRQLQNEKDLIKNRKGLHFTPVTGDNSFAALEAASRRSQFGAPRERVAQSEIGKRWEDRADLSIYQQPYMDQPQIGIAKTYAELKNAAEGTNIVDKAILDEVNKELEKMGGKYALENPEALAYRTSGGLDNLGFQHLADELDNALNPSMGLPEYLQLTPKTLDKMSVPQVVEHVDKINAWRASQKAEVDKARAANAATVVHKEYPEQGLRWVEIKPPDAATIELPEGVTRKQMSQTQGGLEVPGIGYVEAKYDREIGDLNWAKAEADAKKILAQKPVEDALKYEGEILQHCVGGYCPDVVEGRSRIFSLRDEDGRPHATIEVEPVGYEDVFRNLPFEQKYEINAVLEKWLSNIDYTPNSEELVAKSEQVMAQLGYKPKEQISQIKGLQNKKPEAEFIPYIQDFVKSGDWSDVGDIKNTDLYRVTPGQKLPGFSKEIEPGYYTLEDFQKMAVENEMPQEILDSWMNKLQDKYRYGYAKGGGVKRRNGVTKADLEREYRMAFGGGVFNTDPDITDAGRIIPEHTI